MTPLPIGGKDGKGEEDIDLSVVLGDQLIPIVCASTDRNQRLVAYGLFLHGKDKEPHHDPPNLAWKVTVPDTQNCLKTESTIVAVGTCDGKSELVMMKNLEERNKERPNSGGGPVCVCGGVLIPTFQFK